MKNGKKRRRRHRVFTIPETPMERQVDSMADIELETDPSSSQEQDTRPEPSAATQQNASQPLQVPALFHSLNSES